jgi:regulator of cell morphogenesis and NO signaling
MVRMHGARHPELHDLQRLFVTMQHALESHMATEERVVFPICRRAEADPAPVGEGVLALHEQEHAETGDALVALRELAHDYDTTGAPCGTHRRLLDALQRFELDLHQHIHEENNVLFPRARALR